MVNIINIELTIKNHGNSLTNTVMSAPFLLFSDHLQSCWIFMVVLKWAEEEDAPLDMKKNKQFSLLY